MGIALVHRDSRVVVDSDELELLRRHLVNRGDPLSVSAIEEIKRGGVPRRVEFDDATVEAVLSSIEDLRRERHPVGGLHEFANAVRGVRKAPS